MKEEQAKEELIKIVIECLDSENGSLRSAVNLATNFSMENSISPDSLLELFHYYDSSEYYSLAYVFALTCSILSTEDKKKQPLIIMRV